MDKSKKEILSQWVHTWSKAGKALEKVKQKELQKPVDSSERKAIDSMLSWACKNAQSRKTSGLTEQQRYFMMLKNSKSLTNKP